jgi:hypothetical protein
LQNRYHRYQLLLLTKDDGEIIIGIIGIVTAQLLVLFWGMRGESSCNLFLLLFMAPWVPISTTLCRRAVLMLWHAFLFLGLRPVGFLPRSFFAGWFSLLFLVRILLELLVCVFIGRRFA